MLENESVEQSADLGGTQASSPESTHNDSQSVESSNQSEVRQALYELEKIGKFKFEGQEWTAQDLKKAILRQKDYTQKTQALSEDRKKDETSRNFDRNLYWDLQRVKEDPQTYAAQFLKVYPEEYHHHVREALKGTQGQQVSSQNQQQNAQKPQVDIETLTRLQKLESHLHEQQVTQRTSEINTEIDKLSRKYPDAIPEMAIAKVYDKYAAGEIKSLDAATWEKAFKEVSDQLSTHYKARYSTQVKKQTEANKKARDVEAGGGTPGRAPQKFKNLKDVTNFAVSDLTRK